MSAPEEAPGIGHNSAAHDVAGVAGKTLLQHIETIERMKAEAKDISTDVSDQFKIAKGQGFDPKIMRKLIAIRNRSKAEVEEEETLLDVYKSAIGM